MKKTIMLLSAILLFNGCNIINSTVNKLGGTYQWHYQGEYRYHSVDSIQLAGMRLGNASSIPVSKIASIATALAGGAFMQNIPFSMTLNIDVTNPNKSAAFLDALEYVVHINEMEFAEGNINTPIRIEPGETQTVPIPVSADLRNMINRYSQQRIANEMSAFLGITPNKTSVTVKLLPKFIVSNTLLKPPVAIPVVFDFGGKE
jgi:LEA14-like dessication related protein